MSKDLYNFLGKDVGLHGTTTKNYLIESLTSCYSVRETNFGSSQTFYSHFIAAQSFREGGRQGYFLDS